METTILAVIIAVLGSGGLWGVIQLLLDAKIKKRGKTIEEINKKLDSMVTADEMKAVNKRLDSIQEDLSHTKDLGLSTARDRISFLCNKYMDLGYIPFNDYVAFKCIGESYINANGNTEIKEKFTWVMENLQPKNIDK